MAINYETGEEEDDYFDSSLYDEGSIPVASTFPTQDLVAQDQALTAQLPVAAPAGMAQFSPVSTPGSLTISGAGPGMINVNGELQPSRAAPQPLPWWIAQADAFKEQRRQEDDQYRQLQQLMQLAPTVEAQKGVARAKQLQAQIAYKGALQAGEDPAKALAKYAVDLFPNAPRAVAQAVGASRPRGMSEGEKARLALSTAQFEEAKKARSARAEEAKATKAKATEESQAKERLRFVDKDITKLRKQIENDPTILEDTAKFAAWNAKFRPLEDERDSLLNRGKKPTSPAGPVSTPAARAAVGPIRVRNKKTGKVRTYTGSPEDLKDDPEYELAR